MIRWLLSLVGLCSPWPRLVQQARSTDPEARQRAAVELATAPEAWANDELIRLLQDSHTPIRETAKLSLRQRGVGVLSSLLGALEHTTAGVAQTAAELLGELRKPESIDPLLVALKYGPRPGARLAAKRALQAFGAEAVPALTAVRDETEPWVRRQIEEILEQVASSGKGR